MSELRWLSAERGGGVELRAVGDKRELVGYGAVWMRYSQNLGGFVEQVDPGAFADTLGRGAEGVVATFNHDMSALLGTVASGTLRLAADVTGLAYAVDMDDDDPDAVRVMAKVKTGKVRGSSFMFRTLDDSWGLTDQGFPLRTLLRAELMELGPVTAPAYKSTEEAGAAVALRSLASHVGADFERVAEAARSNTLALFLGASQGDLPEPAAAPQLARRRPRFIG
jgi:HK97 family phage prohead protease